VRSLRVDDTGAHDADLEAAPRRDHAVGAGDGRRGRRLHVVDPGSVVELDSDALGHVPDCTCSGEQVFVGEQTDPGDGPERAPVNGTWPEASESIEVLRHAVTEVASEAVTGVLVLVAR